MTTRYLSLVFARLSRWLGRRRQVRPENHAAVRQRMEHIRSGRAG